MHGRPRQKSGPPDPERVKAAQQKAALFGQLAREVLERRQARRYDPESLALAAKLLELHPEVYTAWNYRREAAAPALAAGGEGAVAAVAAELALTERALRKNPKSYATWHHRKWVVAKGFCSLEHELALVGQLLDADERNFHGWGYRRFVVQLMGTPAARELEYAEHKINQNFSNYSAWHSRTALLPVLYRSQDSGSDGSAAAAAGAAAAGEAAEALAAALAAGAVVADGDTGAGTGAGADTAAAMDAGQAAAAPAAAGKEQPASGSDEAVAAAVAAALPPGTSSASATSAVPKDALDAEYELVKQAFYTEPEDQSGWFYHRWLLGCSLAHWEAACGTEAEEAERQALLGVLSREQQTCEELLEIEPDAKWPLLTLTRLKELQQQVLTSNGSGVGGSRVATAADADSGSGLAVEVAAGYSRLKELDPLRRGYYEDAEEGRAYVVARPAAVQ